MNRWCSNLMLVAAWAVAMPGCAHDRAVGRTATPAEQYFAPPQIALAGGDSSGEESQVVQAAFDTAPVDKATAAEVEVAESQPDESQTTDIQVVRGAEPNPVPGMEFSSGPQPKLTLAYLSRLAQENHPLLRRDQARITSASGQALQAGLYPNPTFDTNNPQIFNGPQGTALNAGFQQELVVKGKLRLDRTAALRAQEQAEFTYVQDKYALLAQVRNQFYQTLAAQFRVDVLKRLLIITDASVKTANERVKATTGDRTEVLLLTIDYDRTQADLANALRVLDGERKQLAAIVGFPGLVNESVVGSLTADPPVFDDEAIQQFVVSENAIIQIAKLDIDRNKILLKRAEVEPFPNITIGPAYQYGLNKTQEQFWMTVIFPIPVSNRNQGNILSARADIKNATETLGTVQLDLLRKVADSLSTHRGAVAQADQYKNQIIKDAREALRLAKSGYDAGLFEFSVYLQAQRTVIDATKEYVDILERVWTTAADISGLLQMDQFP